jgi:uncharacterized Zn-finger protein
MKGYSHSTKYMHHTNKKTIKSQNRNKNTTAIFIQTAWVSIFSFQKYVCYKCGKQFTMKRNLTRHMKTHVQYSQTYSCNMCGKEFSVPIIRNVTRNPTTTQLPVPFVVNFIIEGKTCSVTELSTKDLK